MLGRRRRCSFGTLLVETSAVATQSNEVAGEVSREMRLLTSKNYRVCFEEQIEDGIYHGHEEGGGQYDWLSKHAEGANEGH